MQKTIINKGILYTDFLAIHDEDPTIYDNSKTIKDHLESNIIDSGFERNEKIDETKKQFREYILEIIKDEENELYLALKYFIGASIKAIKIKLGRDFALLTLIKSDENILTIRTIDAIYNFIETIFIINESGWEENETTEAYKGKLISWYKNQLKEKLTQ